MKGSVEEEPDDGFESDCACICVCDDDCDGILYLFLDFVAVILNVYFVTLKIYLFNLNW